LPSDHDHGDYLDPKEKDITTKVFVGLVTALSPELEIAGEKYEELRRQLIKFFDWRGAFYADQLGDETLNRVMKKIEEGEQIENILAVSLGIARFVYKEHIRHPDNRRVEVEELFGLAAPPVHLEEGG
jgi:DNA-directed RNA polymerase specialized sigma24 family protein